MIGQPCRTILEGNILKQAIPQNNSTISGGAFYFDENTDNVDSYVTKGSQCAAILNYGELQILELLKNTLPNRLYSILFPVDNLRDAITTAKRVLIKEKIDRQKSGQSSTTPFMRVSDSNHSSMRASKKGVIFDAMETIERYSNSIDKLTTLVSKMNMKIDKRYPPYKPQIYQGRPRVQSKNRQNGYQSQIRSFSRDRNQIRNRNTTTETIIGPIIGIDLGTTIGVTIEEITTGLMKSKTIIGKTIEETILEIDKIVAEMTPNRDIEIESRENSRITKMTI